MSDEDRYGKLRDIDFKVGLHGYKDPDRPGGMSGDAAVRRIEGLLRALKVPERDIAETAEAVIRSAENGRHNPEAEQKKVTRIFIEPLLRGHDKETVDKAVEAVHQTARMHVREKFAFEIRAAEPDAAAPRPTVQVKPPGRER